METRIIQKAIAFAQQYNAAIGGSVALNLYGLLQREPGDIDIYAPKEVVEIMLSQLVKMGGKRLWSNYHDPNYEFLQLKQEPISKAEIWGVVIHVIPFENEVKILNGLIAQDQLVKDKLEAAKNEQKRKLNKLPARYEHGYPVEDKHVNDARSIIEILKTDIQEEFGLDIMSAVALINKE